jgi:hypothetical protein
MAGPCAARWSTGEAPSSGQPTSEPLRTLSHTHRRTQSLPSSSWHTSFADCWTSGPDAAKVRGVEVPALNLQPDEPRVCTQEVSGSIPRDSLAGLTRAGDEGDGVGAATFRMAPRPPPLRIHRSRTRTLSMACKIWNAAARLQRCWATTSPETPTFTANPGVGLTINERSLAGTHGHIRAALTLSAVRSRRHSYHSQADSPFSITVTRSTHENAAAQTNLRISVLFSESLWVQEMALRGHRRSHQDRPSGLRKTRSLVVHRGRKWPHRPRRLHAGRSTPQLALYRRLDR